MQFHKVLEDAGRPFLRDRRASPKLVWGGFLSIVPILHFWSLGYVLSIMEDRLTGSRGERLPSWRDSGRLFLRGVVFFLVILTYTALPYLFTIASFRMLRLGFVFFLPALITMVIAGGLWLVAVHLMPMAMVLLLSRGSARLLLNVPEILYRISLILAPYVQASLLNLGLVALAAMPLAIFPRYGFLLTAPLTFLAMTYLASVYGVVCRLPGAPREEGSPAQP
jgi:hypothetical protein